MRPTEKFPPITGIRWFNLAILTITPAVAWYGLLYVQCCRRTLIFSGMYYLFSMFGEPEHILFLPFRVDVVALSRLGITAGMINNDHHFRGAISYLFSQAITACGHTVPLTRHFLCSAFLSSEERVPFRVRVIGGPVRIVHTTDTRIRIAIPMTPTAVYYGPILDG